MSSQPINASALGAKPPTLQALPPGSTSIYKAGQLQQQQNIANTSCLNGNCPTKGGKKWKGGRKGGNKWKGGTSSYVIPTVSTNGVKDAGATQANVNAITSAQVNGNASGMYDACAGQGPSCTANSLANSPFSKTGGSKRSRRGGWPKWGCLSGGKRKSRKSKKSRTNRKSRKNRRHH